MELTPIKIYENFINGKVSKNETLDLLITLIENFDDDLIRKESIDTLNKIDFNHSKIFKTLEQILISEPNQDLRASAAQVIKKKFIKRALNPFIWALQHESSYQCLITIIESLDEIRDFKVISILLDEIKKLSNEEAFNEIIPSTTKNLDVQPFYENLVEILINLISIKRLRSKFDKIKYKIENGSVTELDFSNVDKKIINWHDREFFQDCSDIIGIKNLKSLKKIEFFRLEWLLKNEFTFKSAITLIEVLEKLNNNTAKNVLVTQIYKIPDKNFCSSINDPLKFHQSIEGFSISKLSDILRNYLTLAFLKKRYPSIEYNIEKGEIISICIENIALTTVPGFIKYFQSLQSLTLKGCRLCDLPESIGSFDHLRNLDLRNNNLKTIPKTISSLKSLKFLNLSNNKLYKLPSSIGNLSTLQILNLETNNLTSFPRSIGHLTSLKQLNASKNNFQKIPSSIGALKYLNSLNLNYNKLKNLPHSIGLLYSLENLNIDNNNLEKIPNSISSISSLKTLSLEDNKLKKLPEFIGLLKSLEILRLGWNKIEQLPNSIGSLIKIKYLRLTNNQIQEFPDSICSLSFLEFLDVSHNKLEVLPEKFGQITSLRILNLSDNELKKIPNTIGSLNSLEKLNLIGNQIFYIPKSIKLLSSLEEIKLDGNKLLCIP
ncbi:MAG: hypothetical protein ACFE91_01120 [Promethearchaeota archaeon]